MNKFYKQALYRAADGTWCTKEKALSIDDNQALEKIYQNYSPTPLNNNVSPPSYVTAAIIIILLSVLGLIALLITHSF